MLWYLTTISSRDKSRATIDFRFTSGKHGGDRDVPTVEVGIRYFEGKGWSMFVDSLKYFCLLSKLFLYVFILEKVNASLETRVFLPNLWTRAY